MLLFLSFSAFALFLFLLSKLCNLTLLLIFNSELVVPCCQVSIYVSSFKQFYGVHELAHEFVNFFINHEYMSCSAVVSSNIYAFLVWLKDAR
jgi:hypothetical protein